MVDIRLDIIELNACSLLDESVLEDTKSALSASSGSSILKDLHDPFYFLVKEFQDVVCHDPPLFYLQIEVSVTKIIRFLGPNTVPRDSGPCLRRNVVSLMTSFVPITKQEWYVRGNLSTFDTDILCQKKTERQVAYCACL